MYFQLFPEEVRPRTLITRDRDEIKAFAKEEGRCVLKPLQGSGGASVFLVQQERYSQPESDDRRGQPRRIRHLPGILAGRGRG